MVKIYGSPEPFSLSFGIASLFLSLSHYTVIYESLLSFLAPLFVNHSHHQPTRCPAEIVFTTRRRNAVNLRLLRTRFPSRCLGCLPRYRTKSIASREITDPAKRARKTRYNITSTESRKMLRCHEQVYRLPLQQRACSLSLSRGGLCALEVRFKHLASRVSRASRTSSLRRYDTLPRVYATRIDTAHRPRATGSDVELQVGASARKDR